MMGRGGTSGLPEQESTGGPCFPATSWSLVERLRESDPAALRQGLESLCRRYWKPVFYFSRAAWSKTDDQAKDLTQDFFVWILEGDALRKYSPEKGGFRKYLKSLLRHFEADRYDREHALKRGGGVKVVTLDADVAPLAALLKDESASDPERTFDLAWKEELLSRAIDRTRQWFLSSGRTLQFRAFEEYDLADAKGPSYAEVARRLGVKEGDVRNWLFDVRERVRTEIRLELTQTVSNVEDLEEEWKNLFG
jgi:RNA polymerase sigma factor (sigma-70 family)